MVWNRKYVAVFLMTELIFSVPISHAQPLPSPTPWVQEMGTSCKDKTGDELAHCVCEHQKDSDPKSQIKGLCTAYHSADTTTGMEWTMALVDTASATACWLACAVPENPAFAERCNCLGLASGILMLADMLLIIGETKEAPGTAQSFMLVLGAMGVVIGGPSSCTKMFP